MESISKNGWKLFRGIVGPDSKPFGSISLSEDSDATFTPEPDMRFTYQELHRISELLKQAVKANDGTK